MKAFMDADFLLSGKVAKVLYHEHAAKCPIIDYHCHLNPEDIARDRRFENITRLWLEGDHYKWRYMRAGGVDEALITGAASDREKFMAWAGVLGKAIGNPLFHWSHLELRRYFGFEGVLNQRTAPEVWELCNDKLQDGAMSARNLIRRSGVVLLCTTDDPIDPLRWHQEISADGHFSPRVLPAWRPDRAVNLEKSDYQAYIGRLAACGETAVDSVATLKRALSGRMDYFAAQGCRLADHGLEYIMYAPAPPETVEAIFQKRRHGESVTAAEVLQFKTDLLLFLGREYHARGWTMQLHYGCKRDNNSRMYNRLGPDSGFDCIGNPAPMAQAADFLNELARTDELPKTIIYSLNPNDNAAIGTIAGCFQDGSDAAKIQQGSAWWFNDHRTGIREQLLSLAALGNLAGFIGMLTDSRSYLSYPRHEYFRRILCNTVGELVENGEFPYDMAILAEIVTDISFRNALKYFEFTAADIAANTVTNTAANTVTNTVTNTAANTNINTNINTDTNTYTNTNTERNINTDIRIH